VELAEEVGYAEVDLSPISKGVIVAGMVALTALVLILFVLLIRRR